MAKSLRDQLVEAGLASASSAKKAEKQQRAEAQAKRQAAQGKAGGAKGKGGNKPGAAAATGKGGGKGSGAASATPESPAQRAKRARAEKARRDQELAKTQNSKTQAKAIRAQIKQLITAHDQRVKTASEEDVAYNFLHGKKIKRIHVPPAQMEALSTGRLVIVNNDGRYHLVNKDIGAKIAERDPKWIIAAHDNANAKPDEEMDEYYKQFEVPDDLDW